MCCEYWETQDDGAPTTLRDAVMRVEFDWSNGADLGCFTWTNTRVVQHEGSGPVAVLPLLDRQNIRIPTNNPHLTTATTRSHTEYEVGLDRLCR
jgi:hypothetical protein